MFLRVFILVGIIQMLASLCVFAATPQSAMGGPILAFNEKRSSRPQNVYTRVPDNVVTRMEIRDPGENAQVIAFRKSLESTLKAPATKVLESLYEVDLRNLDVDLHTKDWPISRSSSKKIKS